MPKNKLILDNKKLLQLLDQKNVRIVDLRAKEAYLVNHIEGALHFDASLFNRSNPPIIGLLPSLEEFNAAVSELGVTSDQLVVAYDDATSPLVGRFVWVMLAFGHTKAAMLNGGYQNWLAHDGAVSTAAPSVQPQPYQGKLQNSRIVDANYLMNNLHKDSACILDARSPAEYAGEDCRSARGGHIPGAININWMDLKLGKNPLLFKSDDELEAMLSKAGIAKDMEIVAYCQSHQRSALVCVVLEHLGYGNIKGYPGAWSDWGNRQDTPIER